MVEENYTGEKYEYESDEENDGRKQRGRREIASPQEAQD